MTKDKIELFIRNPFFDSREVLKKLTLLLIT